MTDNPYQPSANDSTPPPHSGHNTVGGLITFGLTLSMGILMLMFDPAPEAKLMGMILLALAALVWTTGVKAGRRSTPSS